MVMGGDSRCKGRGFESRHHILDGHSSHIFVIKIVMFERTKINEKETGMPHLKINFLQERKVHINSVADFEVLNNFFI